MRNIALFVAAAGFAAGSTGCSSFVPFTYELRAQHRLSEDEVKNLQFYSSHKITLRREVQSEDRQVTPGHRLRLLSGKSVEEVVIPAKTPGVAVRVSGRAISVSFTNGTSLDFVSGSRSPALGSYGELLQPFAISEGTYKPKAALRSNFFGQYAEPPNGPVKVVRNNNPPPAAPVYDDPSGSYFLAPNASGQIPFAGLSWEGVDETMQAHLLIRSDKLEETEERRTVLPGVKLDN